MAQVPGSAFSFQDVVNVFGGSGSFADYYRSGPYVPNIPQNYGIADNPGGLALDQFANSTNYVPMGGSISPNPASAGGVSNPSLSVSLSVWNGVPGYSYNWWLGTTSSGGSGTASLYNAGAGGASISGSANRTSGGYWNGVVYCTITDATGNSITVSATVNFTMTKAGGVPV